MSISASAFEDQLKGLDVVVVESQEFSNFIEPIDNVPTIAVEKTELFTLPYFERSFNVTGENMQTSSFVDEQIVSVNRDFYTGASAVPFEVGWQTS